MRARKKTKDVDNAKLDRAFSTDVKQRDGYVCRMEMWKGGRWVEHGIQGSPLSPLHPSHIYKRDDCGSLRFNPIVALASCRDCHDKYGEHDDTVRVPLAREEAAYRALCLAVTKWKTVRRKPPTRPLKRAV